jgi:DNA modification methylase
MGNVPGVAHSGKIRERSHRRDQNGNPWTSRHPRSVWTIATHPFPEAHFATFPPALVEPCILAGSRPGDIVLDPFGGSGTVGVVAKNLGRRYLLIELNPEYCRMAEDRIARECAQRSFLMLEAER